MSTHTEQPKKTAGRPAPSEPPDMHEHGGPKNGAPQKLDRRLFFQLTASPNPRYEVTTDDLLITVSMPNTSVNTKNNKRRLDLRYFQTPVQSVVVRTRGRDAVATIKLKRSVEPHVRQIADKNGYTHLILEFPRSP